MSRHTRKHWQSGFTILELMIATTVFSVVLLLCATAMVQVGRMYYKGVITNKTEEQGRKVMDDIAQAVQFGNRAGNFRRTYVDTSVTPARRVLCLGAIRYTYILQERSLGSTNTTERAQHVLWKDRIGTDEDCRATNYASGQELLSDNMRVVAFDAVEDPSSSLWNVAVTIAYGDSDLFTATSGADAYKSCVNTKTGGQFCAVSDLRTKVVKRL